jgi:hydroxymethylglutaryl-CoA reductase (NADPH)
MPTPKQQAAQIIRRLARGLPLEVLARRLAPRSPEEHPPRPEVPHPREWSRGAWEQRVAFFEGQGTALPHLAGRAAYPDPAELRGNVEAYLGMTWVPTGVIGPLRVNGLHAQGDYYVPLATSEGALVASYHRGARLITLAGGAAALTTIEQVQRAPGFAFKTLAEAAHFGAWVIGEFDGFHELVAKRSRHARLLDVHTHLEANYCTLIFAFHTGDASGQNMVTFCTEAICEDILARTPVKPHHWFLEANMSGDKKANILTFLQTRGRKVEAEVVLPRALVERTLRTTPERMCDYWRMSFVGGAQTGSVGVSGHIANGLAAVFLACGQDVACVSEASVGVTRLELTDAGELYCGITMPNVITGTVGGGTRLPTARECLCLMGCEGEGKASAFAEIVTVACLAGEISIVGALCAGEFSSAHARFGRQNST